MTLTRRDFIRLANMIAFTEFADDEAEEYIIEQLCKFCLESNPRFDCERFREYIKKVEKDTSQANGLVNISL